MSGTLVTARTGRILFVFLDGVGLGEDDPAVNPFLRSRLPTLDRLLGGRRPTATAAPLDAVAASVVGLDATLGIPGLPQSGTGQAALLTGENAARLFGRHYGPWTPTALQSIVATKSVLARAVGAGLRVAFANAYPEEALRPDARGRSPLRAGPPLAARAAGLLTRHTRALARGDAVASEITNDGWRERLGRDVPRIEPADAGRALARIAAGHDLTLFAHYSTDTAGHRGAMAGAVEALERVDAFLSGIVDALPPDLLLLVASDHGNVEDVRVGHTRNPAFALAAGPGHRAFLRSVHALTDVAPAILARLGID